MQYESVFLRCVYGRFRRVGSPPDPGYYPHGRRILLLRPPLGVPENLLALLYALEDGKPHSQKEICEDWLIPKTTINTIVKEQIAAGRITLRAGKGKREKIICLTESGHAYAQKALQGICEAERVARRAHAGKARSGLCGRTGGFRRHALGGIRKAPAWRRALIFSRRNLQGKACRRGKRAAFFVP